MIDAGFIKECADPRLSVEIVQQFVQEIGAPDHLQVTVRSGNRTFAIPKPKTPEEAMTITKQYLGQAIVRVGLTQYPAGLGVQSPDDLNMNLFDSCENLRMGTAMFSKIYRIVTKWYGNPRPEAFEDAMLSYKSGYFEGESVFYSEDPGDVKVWKQAPSGEAYVPADDLEPEALDDAPVSRAGEMETTAADPNKASMRINLNGIKAHNIETSTGQ